MEGATRILFFTGKGGVGKTSMSCATSIALAGTGKQVLLVSTDPASNLDEVLGVELSSSPTPVPGAGGLWALNINPEAAAHAYRERVVGPYRGVLPDAAITSMEEQLSGACTVEIAAFDEFTRLLGDPQTTSEFEHIIFDTAPTGHTLRLLKLPSAWTGFIANNTTGTSCLGPLAGLQTQQALYESSLRTLSEPATTTLVLVSRPEPSALLETDRTRRELSELGLTNQYLILNALFIATDRTDPAALALEARGQEALAQMPDGLAGLPRLEVPLLPFAAVGIANLARIFSPDAEPPVSLAPEHTDPGALPGPLSALIDDLEKMGRGVVMTMGKGGVGKTTIAAAIAVELAHRGHQVHLSTTDPAAHVSATVNGGIANLRVSRIDPAEETQRYSQEVMARSAQQLDEQGKALLDEDLRSPCTEEIAVFRAFAETVAGGEQGFVVLDTAPTGHTLLLLDAAEAYHRDVLRSLSDIPDSVRNLLPRLRDPKFTKVLLVTLPEATPVHEAAKLQEDLIRAGIQPFAWVVNQSFSKNGFKDPVLVGRGLRELPFIGEVHTQLASRLALVSWKPEPPVGAERLRQLAQPDLEGKL
ncbi:MAG: arsenical pump-driving ATPase [Bryobacterales bacterium]|nr:arsenical pump-driving ATPase [Bryobacterales bacterium]